MACALALALVLQDEVILRNGNRFLGRVTDLGDRVRVERDRVVITFEKSEIERIVYGVVPPAEATEEWRTVPLPVPWVEPGHGIVLFRAARWQAGDPFGNATVSVYGPGAGDSPPRFDVIVGRATGRLEEVWEGVRQAYLRSDPDAEFAGEGRVTTGTLEGRRAEIRFARADRRFRALCLMWMLPGERTALAIHLADADAYERTAAEAEAMARSIRPCAVVREAHEPLTQAQKALEEGRHGSAFGLLDDAERAGADGPALWWLEWRAGREVADWGLALRAAERIHAAWPENPRGAAEVADLLILSGRREEAEAVLDRALEADPYWEPLRTLRGIAWLDAGRLDEAAGDLERSLRLDPASVRAHFHLGLAYERMGRFPDARAQFGEVLRLSPGHAAAQEAFERVRGR